ncbi:hypothetical protein AMS68_002763 [Peltaster fructicola]|uniref:Uncharacterized protein n=1 Tax=Peltaster fructicola TaxID=286661 RepID=A0A6H0XRD1_9PEZI|nr:hypothetical protein AMS68_002763 [Peltaster fructicola]
MAPLHQKELAGIVGHACRVAGATSPSTLWENITTKQDVRSSIPTDRFNIDAYYDQNPTHIGTTNTRTAYFLEEHPGMFDATFFRLSRKEAEAMDPQQRLLLEVVYEALEDAGITMSSIAGSNTSVFTGSFSKDYQRLLDLDPASQPQYAVTGMGTSMTSSRISHFFDLHGESVSIDTACSSTLTALHYANQSLRAGKSDLAIVAGSALHLHPGLFAELADLGMLSSDGASQAYDAKANGYARGEAIAAIVLSRVEDTIKRHTKIKAVIRATALNHDGATYGITLPSQDAQEALIKQTYREAELVPADTQYFEGHGTGTVVGDEKEVNAIASVFGTGDRTHPLLLGSVKTNVGHTEGAAGLVSLIKVTMALQQAKIPPSMHFDKANESVQRTGNLLKVPTELTDWPITSSPRRASVNSFGYGGANAHVILESYTQPELLDTTPQPSASSVLIPLTAQSEISLREVIKRTRDYCLAHKDKDLDLLRLAHTLSAHRTLHACRTIFLASDSSNLVQELDNPQEPTLVRSKSAARVGFVFTGQGAAYAQLGLGLYGTNEVFTKAIDRCDVVLKSLPDGPAWSIADEMALPQGTSNILKSEYAQPICACLQLALVDVLSSWAVLPTTTCGHSSGEIAAAYASGIISFETAVVYAYYRGLYTSQSCPEASQNKSRGTMLAIGMSEAETASMLSEYRDRLTLAAVNSPSSCTISGDEDAIEEVDLRLAERDIFSMQVNVKQAYHSHHMKAFAQRYEDAMSGFAASQVSSARAVPMFSAVTARLADRKKMGPRYWIDNLLSPVRFTDALTGIVLDEFDEQRIDVILEIGSDALLRGPIRQTLAAMRKEIPVLPTLLKGVDAAQALRRSAAALFSHGAAVDLDAVNDTAALPLLTDLPSYPWDHQMYWATSRLSDELLLHQTRHHLMGWRLPSWTSNSSRWRSVLRIEDLRPFHSEDSLGLTLPMMLSMTIDAFRCRNIKASHPAIKIRPTRYEQLKSSTSTLETITELFVDSAAASSTVSIHAYDCKTPVEVFRAKVELLQQDTSSTNLPTSTTDKFTITAALSDKDKAQPELIRRSLNMAANNIAAKLDHSQLGSATITALLSKPWVQMGDAEVTVSTESISNSATETQADVRISVTGMSSDLLTFEGLHFKLLEQKTSGSSDTPALESKMPKASPDSLTSLLQQAPDKHTQLTHLAASFFKRLSTLTGIPSSELSLKAQLSTYGLDSLMASDIRNWFLKSLKAKLTLGALLNAESIRSLLEKVLEGIPTASTSIASEPVPSQPNADTTSNIPAISAGDAALSTFQNRLWFTQTWADDNTMFNCRLMLMISGHIDQGAMRNAWLQVAQVNSVFRTAFYEGDHHMQQKIVDLNDIAMPFEDLSESADAEAALESFSRNFQAKEFDLSHGEVFRIALVKLGAKNHALVFIVHHLVFDRGSCHRMLEQVASFYDDALARRAYDVSKWKHTHYVDFTSWHNERMKSDMAIARLDHWRTSLAGMPSRGPLLPFIKQEQIAASHRISTAVHRMSLDPRLMRRMKRLSSTLGMTPFHFVLGSFGAFVHRYSDATDFAIMAVDGDRAHPDVADIIGLFTNMLPIRIRSDFGGAVEDVLRLAKDAALDAMAHAAPFDDIVRAVGVKVEPGVFPIGQIAINYQVHGTMPKFASTDFVIERLMTEDVPTACDMSLEAIEDPERGLQLALEHSVALYDAKDMSRFLENFLCFLESSIKDIRQPVSEVPMTGSTELAMLAAHWAAVDHHNLNTDLDIAQRIRQMALFLPDQDACLTSDGKRITYTQLVHDAERIAAQLVKKGVQARSHVGLYTSPGIQEIVGMVAILFCRSAYVALDPKFAAERLAYMASDSGAAIVLVGDDTAAAAQSIFKEQKLIRLSEAATQTERIKPQASRLDDPFYVTYTSGSTGKPKGTIMRHSNATPMLATVEEQYQFTKDDRFLHQITMAFDLSVIEIWSPLLVGATMCIASSDARRDAAVLASFMHDAEVTFTYFTPTQFALLLEADSEMLQACHKWRVAWFCGEAFPSRLAKAFYDLNLAPELYNTYGPCEAMVQATIYRVPRPEADVKAVPIGYTLPTVQTYLLDGAQNPLPIGVPGELYLGGPQVGLGYLHRPDETAKGFLDDQFASELFPQTALLGGKMFRTGDMCRLDSEMTLHFLGRKAGDTMLKLRGLRIDVGEIEQNIMRCANTSKPTLRDVVVTARMPHNNDQDNADQLMDERQLFAFLVLIKGVDVPKTDLVADIVSSLRIALNEYMVPSGFVFFDDFPTTMSGKTDRKTFLTCNLDGLIRAGATRAVRPSLQETTSSAASSASSQSPAFKATSISSSRQDSVISLPDSVASIAKPGSRDANRRSSGNVPARPAVQRVANGSSQRRSMVQRTVTDLFRSTLQLPAETPIDQHADYFGLGGSSLSMMRLHSKLKQGLSSTITLKELFAAPTLYAITNSLAPGEDEPELEHDSITNTLNADKPSKPLIDWAAEIELPADIQVPSYSDDLFSPTELTDFFMTGADSHQGMHVLAQIMTRSTDIVHVVGTEGPMSKEWLLSRLRHYKLVPALFSEQTFLKRVKVHKGSMTQHHFGFSNTEFVMLGSRVHTIINISVSVSLLKPYSMLREVNVKRMHDIIELSACGSQASTITHLSTFSVPQLQSWYNAKRHQRHRVLADEISARSYSPPDEDENGYGPVRWVGERLLEAAAERGFPVNILRGSAMTGALETGVPEPRVGIVQQGIIGMMATGVAPDMPGYVADFVPVDILADWIYTLAMQEKAEKARIYHVTNPQPLPVTDLTSKHKLNAGQSVELVPMEEWFDLMEKDACWAEGDDARWAGIKAFFSTGHVYWGLDTNKTMQHLRSLGVDTTKCPAVDAAYMDKLYNNWFA